MKNIRLKNPMGMDDDQRMNALQSLIAGKMAAIYDPKTDCVDDINDADDIHHVVTSDGKTALGSKIIYQCGHGIVLVHDTYEATVSATWGPISIAQDYDEDPAGYEMATSDFFWAARS